MMIKNTKSTRGGQVFSVDILFSLLPVMMIIGASLQYLYLVEEDMKSIDSEIRLNDLAERLATKYYRDSLASSDPYILQDQSSGTSDCSEFESALSADAQNIIGSDHRYQIYIWTDSWGRICGDSDKLWSPPLIDQTGKFALDLVKNTSSSTVRFMPVYDDPTDKIIPGEIASVTFTVWEATP